MMGRTHRIALLATLTLSVGLTLLSCTSKDVDTPSVSTGNVNITPVPGILSVSPTETCASDGNFLVITGGNFAGLAPSVLVDGVPATVISVVSGGATGSDVITVETGNNPAIIPVGGKLVDVVVATDGGEATLANSLLLLPACDGPPVVVSINPTTGDPIGGAEITLHGDVLACTTRVSLVGTSSGQTLEADLASVLDDRTITFTAPVDAIGIAEAFDVLVQNDCGFDVCEACWVFDNPDVTIPPNATGLSPDFGPTTGGNIVLISGGTTGLDDVTSIQVAGETVPDSSWFLNGTGQIQLIMPPSPAGTSLSVSVLVTVVGAAGQDLTPIAYSYVGEGLAECGTFAPLAGPLNGGTIVTITAAPGSTLADIDEVQFGGIAGTGLAHPTPTQIVVTTPPYPTDIDVDITLHTDGLLVGQACQPPFDYLPDTNEPPFRVDAITPEQGGKSGDDGVTITGEGLVGVTSVRICDVVANITDASSNEITRAETGAFDGPVPQLCDVVVTKDGASATLVGAFTYLPEVPDGVSFTEGAHTSPEAGGLNFRIEGTNLIGVQDVSFGGSQGSSGQALACDLNIEGDLSLTGIVPAYITPGGPFPADVTVHPVSVAGADPTSVEVEGGVGVLFRYYNNPRLVLATGSSGTGVVQAGDPTVTVVGTNLRPQNDDFVGSVTIRNAGIVEGRTAGDYEQEVFFSTVSDNQLTFGFPTGTAPDDFYDITIKTPNQDSSCVSGWTFTLVQAVFWGTPPDAASVEPAIGSFVGGTEVTITGDFDVPVDSVRFGGIEQAIVSQTATTVVVKTEAVAETAADGTALDVILQNTSGGSMPLVDAFTYVPRPDIASVSVAVPNCADVSAPASPFIPVAPSATLNIMGGDFLDLPGVLKVFLGDAVDGVEATVNFVSATEINASVSEIPDDSAYSITVAYVFPDPPSGDPDDTLSNSLLSAGRTQLPPTASDLSPASGEPGTPVNITGSGLVNVDGQDTVILFDGNPAPGPVVGSEDSISVNAPDIGAPGATVTVTVETCQGTAVAGTFTYPCTTPVITDLLDAGMASTLTAAAGDTIFIAGTNLLDGPSASVPVVTFGGESAIVQPSPASTSTLLEVRVPPGNFGETVRVTVETCGGVSNELEITYSCRPPAIFTISPASGLAGTFVTIEGINLEGDDGSLPVVDFDGVDATVTSASPTSVIVRAPAGAGNATITLVNCGGTAVSADTFAYCTAPTILPSPAGLVPEFGPAGLQVSGAVGDTLTINGGGFIDVDGQFASVTFNDTDANVLTGNDTTLQVEVPSGSGNAVIRVTTCGGTAQAEQTFLFCPVPNLTSATPIAAPPGALITLSGTNLESIDGNTTVTFGPAGNQVAGTIILINSTSITVEAPPELAPNPATVALTVNTCGGQSTQLFTYCRPPVLDPLVSPTGEPGETTTLQGSYLVGANGELPTVFFGTREATLLSVTDGDEAAFPADPDFLLVQVPTLPIGSTVSVTVTTCGGTSNDENFTFTSQGTCTAIPTTAALDLSDGPAGTIVTISGPVLIDNEGAPGAVDFGTTPAALLSFTDGVFPADDTLVVLAPGGIPDDATVSVRVTVCGTTIAAGDFTYGNGCSNDPDGTTSTVNPPMGDAGDTTVITAPYVVGDDGVPGVVTFGVTTATVVDFTDGAGGADDTLRVTVPNGLPENVGMAVYVTTCSENRTFVGTYTVQAATPCDPPNITGVNPSSGPLAGGGQIVLTGSNLSSGATLPATTVTIGGAPATILLESSNSITFTDPGAGAGGVATIVVTTCGGTGNALFTYCTDPDLTALSIMTGGAGDSITLTGSDFVDELGAEPQVFFGTIAADVISATGGSIVALVPGGVPDNTDVPVTVQNCGGTSPSIDFTYATGGCTPPTITGVAPANGGPGVLVQIDGTEFDQGTGTPTVFFDTTEANVIDFTPTRILAVAPNGPPVGVALDIIVVTCTSVIEPGAYTYDSAVCDPPTISSISPASDVEAGGAILTINGSNLASVTDVEFDGTPAADILVVTDDSLTVEVPAGGAGVVALEVTTCGGTATEVFTYCSAPTLTALSSGSGASGDAITLTGTFFDGEDGADPQVFFGTQSASTLSIASGSIVALVPGGVPDGTSVDVTVVTCGGTTLAQTFMYTSDPACPNPPTVTTVAPNTGDAGDLIQIDGTFFDGGTGTPTVYFDTTTATVLDFTATRILVRAPGGVSPGAAVDVIVVTCTSVISPAAFTFNVDPCELPNVTGVEAASGPLAGGDTVVITGTNLGSATDVDFGASAALILLNTSTSITVENPAGAVAGTLFVTVTTACGDSSGLYTYCTAPTAPVLSSATGASGDAITLTGTEYIAEDGVDPQVFFGTTEANVISIEDTDLVVIVPGGIPNGTTVPVTVVHCGGTSGGTDFTYDDGGVCDPPTVTSTLPATGDSGDLVTITGTFFDGGTGAPEVYFDTTRATLIDFNATRILAIAPSGVDTGVAVDVIVVTCSSVIDALAFTYNGQPCDPPSIASVTPATDAEAGGATVIITGSNLSGTAPATSVTIDGSAAVIDVETDNSLTITVPVGTAGPVELLVTTCGGTADTTFTYCTAPVLTSLDVAAGEAGDPVVLTGTGFNGEDGASTQVFFGTTQAQVISNTGLEIIAIAPGGIPNLTTVPVTAVTCGGTTAGQDFQYVQGGGCTDPPTIASISPNNASSGDLITITGTFFDLNGTPQVFFETTGATILDFTATQILVSAPGGFAASTTVDVTVLACGAVTETDGFTYEGGGFDVQSISPTSGPRDGGQTVVINGAGFDDITAASTVTICGVAAATIIPGSPSQFSIETGAFTGGAPAVCDVTVIDDLGQTDTLTMAYTYLSLVPNAATFATTGDAFGPGAHTAPAAGGTAFRIVGTTMLDTNTVRFGGNDAGVPEACNVEAENEQRVTGTVPNYSTPGGPFVAPVEVYAVSSAGVDSTTATSAENASLLFDYYHNPELSSALGAGNPAPHAGSSGYTQSGVTLTITGTDLAPLNPGANVITPGNRHSHTARLLLKGVGGGTSATYELGFTITGDTTITAFMPGGLEDGEVYDVEIRTPGQGQSCVTDYTYTLVRGLTVISGETVANGNCDDDFDNDQDGTFDCERGQEDSDCACGDESTFDGNCFDGIDNDGDGERDENDENCEPVESAGAGNCADDVDNDGDGGTDCIDGVGAGSDGDCNCAASETTDPQCTDGIDNDGDGVSDCDDVDCPTGVGDPCEP